MVHLFGSMTAPASASSHGTMRFDNLVQFEAS
jgi:hypothetical protein